MFQLTIWSLIPFLAACVAIAAFRRSQTRSQVPGRHALSFLFAALSFWCVAQTIGTIVTTERAQLLAAQFSYVGIALTPVAWFLFALTYSQRVERMSRRALNLVCIVPLITMALVMTNSSHNLVWSSWEIVEVEGYRGLVTEHGFWFYVHAIYSYCLILVATAILTFALLQYRQHSQTLLAAAFAPLVCVMANLFYLSPANPAPWFDMTAVGFVAGILILERGLLNKGMLKTLPLVRDRVVEQLADPVLVIRSDGMIVDANVAALSSWSAGNDDFVYSNIDDLMETVPITALAERSATTEITINKRAYEVSSTRLDGSNPRSDIAMVFRDVTARRMAERQLKEAKRELERMAHTDALTGLFNRRFFMERLNEEFERVRRHRSVLSVMIFDLDHFKEVNDTWGHDAGDAVLRAVADITNEVKRVTDIAARIGGEEFALLLPETEKQGAINLAQRLRKAIEIYPWAKQLNNEIQVTASIGVATVSQQSIEPENLLKVADRAMYRAKRNGRNMVCVDTE